MDEDGKSEAGSLDHRFVERDVVDVLEVFGGRRHEGFETCHATFGEHLKLVEVVRLDPAPQREVNERGGFGGGKLKVEAPSAAGGRGGGQRHLHGGGQM